MRRKMQDADISRKILIQKIADFLQKDLPSNTNVSRAASPPETQDVKTGPTSDDPDTSPSLPFLSRAHKSIYASPIKRSLSMESYDDEGEGARYVPGETTIKEFSAKHFGAVASPYISAYVFGRGI